MHKYIFVDNWVYNLFDDFIFKQQLIDYINNNGLIVILSSFSFVELYNPGWLKYQKNDRTSKAVEFYSKVPCVIVDQKKIWKAELRNKLNKLHELPIELDISRIEPKLRSEVLLRFLHADELFLSQGKDIRQWAIEYKRIKYSWFNACENIITNAVTTGCLYRDNNGNFINTKETKEIFLYSLDFRTSTKNEVDEILAEHLKLRKKGKSLGLTSIRMSSLLFWYLYIAIDQSSRIKQQVSDVGDFYNLSLLPYCSFFTVDSSMLCLLSRFNKNEERIQCDILDKNNLLKVIGQAI